MKIAKFFAVIFAVLGFVLMLGTAVVCFASMDGAVKVKKTPDGAVACADALVQALDEGNLSQAAKLMYGQPDFGAEGVPSDARSAMLWEKYQQDMACESASKLYLKDADFVRDITLTVLDTASIIDAVPARAKVLLEQKVAQAQDMAELYDAENNFRADLVDRVMQQALEQAIQENAQYITCQATVKFICRDGQWWAVPDTALLNALSGGMA